jgi:hypothetical protein
MDLPLYGTGDCDGEHYDGSQCLPECEAGWAPSESVLNINCAAMGGYYCTGNSIVITLHPTVSCRSVLIPSLSLAYYITVMWMLTFSSAYSRSRGDELLRFFMRLGLCCSGDLS